MKPGDLVRISSPRRMTRDFLHSDEHHGKVGIIVELEILVNDHRIWNVLIDGGLFPIRERNLETIE